MRVTNSLKMNSLLYNLQRIQNETYRSQEVLATGIEIGKGSDDPGRADRILRLNDEIARQEQYSENINIGKARLSQTETQLQSLQELIKESRSLATQGANEALTDIDLIFLADQVDQILHEVVSVANSRHGSQYLFGGFNTQESPYEMITDQDNGDIIGVQGQEENMDGIIYIAVEDGQKIQSNIPGTDIFQPDGMGGENDLFQILVDLRDALRSDDQEVVEGVIGRFDVAQENIQSALSRIGALVNRFQNTETRIISNNINSVEDLSNTQDADLAEWITRYQLDQLALENALSVGSHVLSASLLDFFS